MKKTEDPLDVLGGIYEKMYEKVVENLEGLEKESTPVIRNLVEQARDKLVSLGDSTAEDAEQVAEWLKRDLEEGVDYLNRTGRDIKEWLGFETTLLEVDFALLMKKIMDPTLVALYDLKQKAQHATYKTGEVTGPGRLVCDHCGEQLLFQRAGRIPPCPKCSATEFHRFTQGEE